MATSMVPVSVSGRNPIKPSCISSVSSGAFVKTGLVSLQSKSPSRTKRNMSIRAEYNDRGVSGGEFVAGFILGGAVAGTLAYIFAPQIRKALLNEDEYGFRRPRGPIYYTDGYYVEDEGLEKTRNTLTEKIGQLNSAIDNIATRLRGGNKSPKVPAETNVDEVGF